MCPEINNREQNNEVRRLYEDDEQIIDEDERLNPVLHPNLTLEDFDFDFEEQREINERQQRINNETQAIISSLRERDEQEAKDEETRRQELFLYDLQNNKNYPFMNEFKIISKNCCHYRRYENLITHDDFENHYIDIKYFVLSCKLYYKYFPFDNDITRDEFLYYEVLLWDDIIDIINNDDDKLKISLRTYCL